MVQALASGVQNKFIDGLSFTLQPGAYVLDRRSVAYHPQGPNIYTPGAGKNFIRILVTGEDWMDPSTLRIMFRLSNLAQPDPLLGNAFPQLRPLGGPWSYFGRMRMLSAGQLVEDIDQHNRIREMMHIMIAKESRENDAAEVLGNSTSHREARTSTGIRESGLPTVCTFCYTPDRSLEPEQVATFEVSTHRNRA
jgi:hypothetical protein